jgi:hypothetical protein
MCSGGWVVGLASEAKERDDEARVRKKYSEKSSDNALKVVILVSALPVIHLLLYGFMDKYSNLQMCYS